MKLKNHLYQIKRKKKLMFQIKLSNKRKIKEKMEALKREIRFRQLRLTLLKKIKFSLL